MKIRICIPRIRSKPVATNYRTANVVPKKYQDMFGDMNNVLSKHDTDVYRGREKEVHRIFNCLLKSINPNLIILGEHGVGKTAVVNSVVHHVTKRKCPKELRKHHFILWDIEKTLAKLSSEDTKIERNLEDFIDFLVSYDNLVVVIDQVHLVATSNLLMYYFSVLLRNSNVKVIGICTETEFYAYFANQTKLFSMVETITIAEPKSKEIYPMIYDYIKVLINRHKVFISEEMVNYIVSVSNAFSTMVISNPGLVLNYIEKSMIVAKRRKHSTVTKEDINSNFNFDYKLYNAMSDEDKKITAYHEAGHFIVSKMSENIKNYKTTAITIVPAENFLGVTLFEFEPEKQTSCDSDYFIDNIATDLAGRVAETILHGNTSKTKFTSGAYSDLKNATQTARDVITEYGMIESCGQHMTVFCNYDLSDLALLSEERKQLIDKETQKLIDIAYKRAESILMENRELLDAIANALIENEVLDEKDLDTLCNQYAKK